MYRLSKKVRCSKLIVRHNGYNFHVDVCEGLIPYVKGNESYEREGNDRNREGGGVCTYIRNDIAFTSRDDLAHDSLETTWFELLLPKTKPIVVGSVYRPPVV